jgi:rsbT co-antagonist protein RsbR
MKDLVKALKDYKPEILEEWLDILDNDTVELNGILKDEVDLQSKRLFAKTMEELERTDDEAIPSIESLKSVIDDIAIEWNKMDVKPQQISAYILSIEPILYKYIKLHVTNYKDLIDHVIRLTNFISKLALYSYSVFVKEKELTINKQEETIKNIEIPILRLNSTTLLIPLMGIIDSEKAMSLMKKSLTTIKELKVHNVILDIEGVPFIDTEVANALIKLEAATRLMGAKMIISGVSPNVAETMVHLGIDLDIPATSVLEYAIDSLETAK